MDSIFKLLIGVGVLVLGYFLGNLLAKVGNEEIKKGKKWFFLLALIGLGGGVYGFVIGNDFLLFTMFFIAIVTSRSLRRSIEMQGEKNIEKATSIETETQDKKDKDSKKKKPNNKEKSSQNF